MIILVLAGGSDQIALIQELKKRGHIVLLVDYFQNPPAKKYADKHFVASTLDIPKVTEIAIQEKVNLICTACTDQALLTVAKVSEDLSLPCYLTYQTALNVTNKSYMKKVMCSANIPTAKYIMLKSYNPDLLVNFTYPLVVKPADCNSSKGVKKVHSEEELKIALDEALEYSRTGSAIIEEFKDGEEISADFYIENGKVQLLSATKSIKIQNSNSFTITQSFYPAITDTQKYDLINIAEQIAFTFNLKNTPLLIQLILKDDKFNVVEFSARMGGGSKYKLIEVLSGVNIMEKYVDLILGQHPKVQPHKQVNYAAMNYIYCKPGIFEEILGLESLVQESYINYYFLYKTKGMNISKAETSSDRVAGYLTTAKTMKELREKISFIDSQIIVLDSSKNDIMIHGLV